ncbi:MAG TPA: DUF192 domain-containing protein [Allosphingosinicella sp.]|nr:DUF192 domain-containing protein [Allosphingosinicella sp.]
MKRLVFVVLCLAAALPGCQREAPQNNVREAGPPPKAPSGLDQAILTIESGGRSHRFTVEVARTEQQQAQGLMGRRTLPADRGMLFPFDPPRAAEFWMRGTLIPLDMLFIRTNGTIAKIAANTVPLSEEPVGTDEELSAVLELRGGRAAELGIREGDTVSWSD